MVLQPKGQSWKSQIVFLMHFRSLHSFDRCEVLSGLVVDLAVSLAGGIMVKANTYRRNQHAPCNDLEDCFQRQSDLVQW